MKIAGVVVWYNPSLEDKKNIESYLSSLQKLYIIDNSEKENSYIANDKIKYICNKENKGIAYALNKGAELALSDGFSWLLTMDQDTKLKNEKLLKLIEYTKEASEDIGIICPWLITKLHIDKPNQKIDYPIDTMTSVNLLNLKVYKLVGPFMDDLFIDGVDMEYCLRLRKYKYKIMRINTIEVEHNLGNIVYKKFFHKNMLCMNHSYVRYYYRVRNYHYIYDMYKDLEPEYCNSIIKFRAMLWCAFFYEKDSLKKVRAMWDGYKDYKKGIMGKYRR